MRMTFSVDDELLAKAQFYTGLTETGAVLDEALRALVARESARRLALLGGTEPEAEPAPRPRSGTR